MSNHPIIAALRAALESERNDLCFEYSEHKIGIKMGHKAATDRLLPIIESMMEVIKYYGNEKNYYLQKDKITGSEIRRSIEFADTESFSYQERPESLSILQVIGGKKAREFLAELEKELK